MAASGGHLRRRTVCLAVHAAAVGRRGRQPRAGGAAHGRERRPGDAEGQRDTVSGKAAAALLAGRRALSHLWRKRVCDPPAQCAGAAGLRVDRLSVGAPRLGAARRILCRAGSADLDRAVSVYALRDSRGAAELSAAAGALLLHHRLRVAQADALLWHVGGAGAGGAHQGADCAHLLYRRRRSAAAAERPMAALAGFEAGDGTAAVPGYRRAVAHSGRPGQSRPGKPHRQPPHAGKRSRLLVLLLCE